MEKKELKFYEAPAVEVVEMEMSASLLTTSTTIPGVEMDDDASSEE